MKRRNLITAIFILSGLTSCQTSYRMVSRIDTDGSLYREVYATGDSAFLAGDDTKNPFLFRIDSDEWQLVKLDSSVKFKFEGSEQDLNVKVCRTFTGMDGKYFTVKNTKEYAYPLVVPTEKIEKEFRWFYTYYLYKATFEELPDKGPIPLSEYLTDEEQRIWLRGDKDVFAPLNGIELNNRLDDIETKFWEWYNRSLYEMSFEVITRFVSLDGNAVYMQRMQELKHEIYKKYLSKKQEDAHPEEICGFLDDSEHTDYYSNLYKANKEAIDRMFEDRGRMVELFGYAVQHELSMPGKLVSSNANLWRSDDSTIIWKVDAFRLLVGEYTLMAESRVPNYWAFAVTLIVVLLALWCVWKL